MRILSFLSFIGLLVFPTLAPCFAQAASIDDSHTSPLTDGASPQTLTSTSVSASSRINFLAFDHRRAYFALSTGAIRHGDRKVKVNLYSPTGDFLGSGDASIKSQTGLVLGARLGVRANDYLATELETNYSQFNSSYRYELTQVNTSMSQSQLLGFANALVYPLGSLSAFTTQDGATLRIEPSLLLGVGFVRDAVSPSTISQSYSKNSFASQFGLGVEGKYAQMVRLGVHYRYLMLNNPMTLERVAPDGHVTRHNLSKADAHMINLQASVYF